MQLRKLSLTRRELFQATTAAIAGAALTSSASSAAPAGGTPPQRLSEGWEYYRGNLGSVWEAWRGKAASDNVAWDKVSLPHCFNAMDAVDPDHAYYQGPGWYRTTLAPANPYPDGRMLLRFEGAGQRTEVFVGLEKVADHVGGYDEWTVDITDAAARCVKRPEANGKIELAIHCDNSRDAEMIPSDQSDFNRYGGLYRPVTLEHVPAISIQRALVETSKTSARVKVRLYNPGGLKDAVQTHVTITAPDGRSVHNGPWQAAAIPVASPALWSPKQPSLYTCTVTLKSAAGEHSVTERFGFRTFDFPKGGVFSLNGEKLFLKGTQRHEDHAGLAAALTDDLIRKEFQLMKEMGCNFVRLGHYQGSRLALELCDELGLIVWEEIPWCRGGIGGPEYREQARRMLRNMIDQHRNHPSVIFWGLGNENDWPGDFEKFDQDGVRAFMSELNDIAHKEDPSRMTAIRRCPFAWDVPDVYSPSIWAGWYSGRYTEYKASIEKEVKKGGRILHIEWGGDSHARRHSEDPDSVIAKISTGRGVEEKDRAYLLTGGTTRASKDGDWSETYICNLFDWHLKEQETMDFLAGSAMWVFKDFSTPLRPENPVPRMNQKGILERDLTPKEGFYVFQSYWSEKPMAHIYGHTWPIRWGAAGEQRMVKVYSNCASAELFVNGKSAGVKQRNSQDFPAAGLRWMAAFKAGENHLRVVAKRSNVEVVDEIRFHYQTEKWDKPAKFTISEVERGNGVVTLEARLFDAKGVQCLDARNAVRCALAGDGELIQNLGTSTGSRQVELYNGRAIIRAKLAKGEAVVSISAEKLPTAFVTVRS
jgi:beta-galactosidase